MRDLRRISPVGRNDSGFLSRLSVLVRDVSGSNEKIISRKGAKTPSYDGK
jgi:hypothetical protein